MKTYTQQDFDALVRDENGYLHCPAGDWSNVKFGGADKIVFAAGCKLGDRCTLGDWCKLGDACTLGHWCKLGGWCKLGDRCTLGNGCKLGDVCKLGDDCEMGDGCTLGNGCALGGWCKLEGGRIQNATFFFVSNIDNENRTAYAYCNTQTGEMYIRAGFWLGDIDAFEQRVRDVHAGTHHETDYLAFAQFARARFARYGESVEETEQ